MNAALLDERTAERLVASIGQDAAAVVAQGAVAGPYLRYYVHPDHVLDAQEAALETRGQQLQRLEADLLAGYAGRVAVLPRRGAAWYGKAVLPLVDAWHNGAAEPIIVGMRNAGRIPGLPDEVMTEGPVLIQEPGQVEPVEVPALPILSAELLHRHATFGALVVRATAPDATREDRVRALMSNPMVRSFDVAAALADDIEAGSPG